MVDAGGPGPAPSGTRTSGRGGTAVMIDVAALAGVSYQTVSRVINDRPGVSAATRQRVVAAMQQLDYRPSSIARWLASGRSHTIGVVAVGSDLYGPATTRRSVEEAVQAAGYGVTTQTLSQFDRGSALGALDRLLRQAVDGIVVVHPLVGAAEAVQEMAGRVPVVVVGAGSDDCEVAVELDSRPSARRAVRHLLDLGHRTVWHVTGPPDCAAAEQRRLGWHEELEAAGAPVPQPLSGDWSAASGYHAGRLLAADPDVTAVFAGNDQMALGVLRALGEAGRDVPGEVSVVGFDDLPEAAYFRPPLTTLRQDFGLEGRLAVQMLLREVPAQSVAPGSPPAAPPGGPVRVPVRIVPELVLRASTARAPSVTTAPTAANTATDTDAADTDRTP